MVIKKLGIVFCIMFIFSIGNIFALNGIKIPVDRDKVAPVLVDFDYSINHRKVTFEFEVEEDNFKQIYYRDVADCNRKYIKYNTLCTRLNSDGECFAVRDLCAGEHRMQITALDKAGNIVRTEEFNFIIDY